MTEEVRTLQKEALGRTTTGSSGASKVGVSPIASLDASDVQYALHLLVDRIGPGTDALRTDLAGAAAGKGSELVGYPEPGLSGYSSPAVIPTTVARRPGP